ncbi:glutathione peroxidase [Asticcacaulis tiandongensis]|uniref:glutathione peroxidase n=1 Tax=Asticcacaulis tiandongensis TaxID=2565365 RepID=UPI00112C40B3|nr:glutathione peroxidase [Asticcacaulis tiandongensis]
MTADLNTIPLKRIDGSDARLADYDGKVRLVVNVASKCGLTPQYEGLEALYRAKKDEGLEILGFPANNFKEQEPGSEADIQNFCSTTYDVTFPLFAKISVAGDDKHPLYQNLTAAQPETLGDEKMREKLNNYGIPTNPKGEVLWNFEKFLIARDGTVAGRFSPDIDAADPRLTDAIEAELKK